MKIVVLIISFAFMTGCIPQLEIKDAINKYDAAANQIELGDSKDKVLSILEPTQSDLGKSYKKSPEKYLNDGKKIDIYFFRSAWQSDGLTTDDEFTPYTFVDGKLVAIGWAAIGGAKTQGQSSPTTVYTQPNNTNQQILNHGAGGCTPNFSTGGCL